MLIQIPYHQSTSLFKGVVPKKVEPDILSFSLVGGLEKALYNRHGNLFKKNNY